VLGGTAVLVGLTSGAGVWAFKFLIGIAQRAMYDGLGGALSGVAWWMIALVPAIGGLIVGVLWHYLVGHERHHGVTGIMESVALSGGRLRYWQLPAKTAAAALSIGAGASVGPEDPSVQIGANFGSMFGRWLRLSDERVQMLVAAGAAGGISAAFNAPIAAVFFAMEIILGELGGRAFSVVVIASVISAVFTQAVAGPEPAFHIPPYAFNSAWELPLYLGLGLLAGPLSALYTKLIYFFRDLNHAWHTKRWIKTAAAGLIVGIAGLALPQILGVGYESIDAVLNARELGIGLLTLLLVAKLLMTPVSIGGGFPGGVFAPSLFLGGMLGGAYGALMKMLFPQMHIDPQAFAMVGMAAVLAGTVHAPLTAVLLLFEMTSDYRIILPLMFAVAVSMVLSQLLHRESVYTLGLKRAGIRLERGRDLEVLEGITVSEVMQADGPVLRQGDDLTAASATIVAGRHHGLPVVDDAGELVGILTLQDINRVRGEHPDDVATVGQACTRDLLVAHPDETIGAAMRRMGARDVGRLPVVDRSNPTRLIGMIRRIDMVRAYNLALTRRSAGRHRAQQVRLNTISRADVDEVTVGRGAAVSGRRVRDVQWPHGSVIATIRRGGDILIPNGDTVICERDILVVVAEPLARLEVEKLCGDGKVDLSDEAIW
jgi:CIC family chloride channel protein